MNMKKITAALLCTLFLAGCGKDIPALDTFSIDTFETVDPELTGCTRDDFIKAWGEPDASLSGLDGDIWELSESPEKLLVVYFETDGTYNSAVITYQILCTGTVTEIGDTADPAAKQLTVRLDDGTSEQFHTTASTTYTGTDALSVGQRANFVCSTSTATEYRWVTSAEVVE